MNTSGEVADLMVKEGIEITEAAAKLAGLGAKNLAAVIIALLNEDTKLQGKTTMKQLLKADKPLCILQIKESNLKNFQAEAKKYGVLFAAIADKTNDTGLCDIIAKQEDTTKLNYIMEKLGYTAPVIDTEPEQNENQKSDKTVAEQTKNVQTRAREHPHESASIRHGDTERTANSTNSKSSVRQKVDSIKQQKKKPTSKTQNHRQTQANSQSRQKKKSNEKGRE